MSEPWVRVYETEIAAFAKASPSFGVLLAVRLLTREGSTTTRRVDVQRLTGLSERSAQKVLRRLERRGLLAREWCGSPYDDWGRFRVVKRGVKPRPQVTGLPRPQVTGHTTQVVDHLQTNPPSKTTEHAPRTTQGGMEGLDELVKLARKLWPNLVPHVVTEKVSALRELAGDDVTQAELAEYLRWAHRDETLAHAKIPLAAACTAHRFQQWLAPRRRAAKRRAAPAPLELERDGLSGAEAVAAAKRALAALKR